ncbi:aminotransferase class I/II-fold pyridoxal phosphate-dependent enzyme [Sporosalibacterium faouarense]|uniref:aminotransferase class I/II-fold pyridoxal phosphate-dependent enzyme n=1 Tax=Sporosalibacterium faouarense TaxID=516123 RepID=UPI00192AD61A|nr:aminotransferase class I/II-fold pyridoxal phosphate-dependent enzyme [Sporosalibacterium faouarense]
MKTPIIDGLMKYIMEENVRFHMPGHKGKEALLNWRNLIPQIDVTEVDGTDNLHNPESIILKSQELAANTFGAKNTFYSINGTTGGIYGSIGAITKPGDTVLIQRNCHRSVYNAVIFNQLNSEYIYPVYNKEWNILTGVLAEDIEKKIKNNLDIKAIIITNPSYYGICSNIQEIAKVVHKYNKILIVDEAHGSHFNFSNNLPVTAIEAGADICIQSTHKTLPAFTQASMVHVGTNRVDNDRLRKMISMYQTTSPSYILMASLDMARAYMEEKGKINLEKMIRKIGVTTTHLKGLDRVKIFDQERINYKDIYDFDTMKILFQIEGISGSSVEKILRKKYNIQLEMSDSFYGVALCSVMDTEEDIDKLANAIENISELEADGNHNTKISTKISNILPNVNMSLHDAFNRSKKTIRLSEAKGEVSGSFLIPYPPGIPILCPGEIITEEIITYIQFLRSNNIQILGYKDNNLENIEIIR